MATIKNELHALVDTLTDAEAGHYLQLMQRELGDSLRRFLLNVPEDDEPTLPEDIEDLEAARRAYWRGETKTLSEVIEDAKRAERSV
jgi:hypothetical protein